MVSHGLCGPEEDRVEGRRGLYLQNMRTKTKDGHKWQHERDDGVWQWDLQEGITGPAVE